MSENKNFDNFVKTTEEYLARELSEGEVGVLELIWNPLLKENDSDDIISRFREDTELRIYYLKELIKV